jgi:hypothetical protein
VRTGRDRREVLGAEPAQVGDQDGASAGLQQRGGRLQAVGVAHGHGRLQHGSELRPEVQVRRRDDGGRFLRLEGAGSGITPGSGFGVRSGAKFTCLHGALDLSIELVLSRHGPLGTGLFGPSPVDDSGGQY